MGYNNDHPAGVSANAVATLLSLIASPVQSVGWSPSGFELQFLSVPSGFYIVRYTTNLNPPVVWYFLAQSSSYSGGELQFIDPGAATNVMRFYRVQAE